MQNSLCALASGDTTTNAIQLILGSTSSRVPSKSDIISKSIRPITRYPVHKMIFLSLSSRPSIKTTVYI